MSRKTAAWLQLAGMGAITAGAWTVAAGLGLAVGGACAVLIGLSAERGPDAR